MIREERGYGAFWGKKDCSAKSDEKIVCSANCKKIKSLFTKLAEKWSYKGGKISLFLCLRGENGLFLVRRERKVAQGKKTYPPNTYHLVRS